ncbi:MAG: type II toxin-antitoxin system Phd/YefM family antitoxin [Chthoniobacterales bacterium]
MNAITYTAARENLASTMDRVCLDHDPVIITRNRDQAVVMLSLDDYESLQETAYLLRSPANARRLLAFARSLMPFLMFFPAFRLSIEASKRLALAGDRSR